MLSPWNNIDLDFEIWNYNLHLLPGTEMDHEESRKKYIKKTGWRLHDNAYGIYQGEKIFEGQETVTETNTLSVEDFRYFRFFRQFCLYYFHFAFADCP